MKLYFRCQLRRVTGKADKPHEWYAAVGTEAETTGRFDDSITFVGFAKAWGNQSHSMVASKWKNEQIRYGESIGFDHCLVVAITEEEYGFWTRQLSEVET